MKYLVLFAQIVLSNQMDSILLVSSTKTPESLISLFSDYRCEDISTISEILLNFKHVLPSLILDVSLDMTSFATLDSISNTYQIPYLTITKTHSVEYSKGRFYVFPPKTEEAKSLVMLLKHFSWESFSVFLSNSQENLEVLQLLKEMLPGYNFKSFIYAMNETEENLDSLIKRKAKITGEKRFLILDQGSSLKNFIKCLKVRKINQFGSFFLFGSSSIFSLDLEGSVILANEAKDFPDSIEKFYFESITTIINNIEFFSLDGFKRACPRFFCTDKFLVINQQNNNKVSVGEVKQTLKIFAKMLFPGNNPWIDPVLNKTKIPVMVVNGVSEVDGVEKVPFVKKFYNGAIFSIEQTNKNFKNFEYQMIPTDCGNNSFNLTWSVGCFLNHFSNLGVAYISSYFLHSALSNLISLRVLRTFIPQVSPYAISDYMNSKSDYPEFLKFTGNFNEYMKNSAFLYKFYGWKDMLCIVDDDDFGRSIFDQMSEMAGRLGLRYITPEEFRYFPKNYTRDDFQKYKNYFEYIKNSKCRILIISIYNPSFILEGLYDVGLRRGDLVIITSLQNYISGNLDIDVQSLNKRLEIFDGALITTTIEYQGVLGKEVEAEMKKKYDSIEMMCTTYDSFQVIHNAVTYLMDKGENYDDGLLLIDAMRTQRFVGCTGDVFFIKDENSISNPWASTLQVSVDFSTKKLKTTQITAFNMLAAVATKQINEPIWATGEKTTPTNYREDSKCVYNKNKQKSWAGLIAIHIYSAFYLLTVIISALLSKKQYERQLLEIPDNAIESYQDFIFRFYFTCQFFQILALEPKGGLIDESISGINFAVGLDLIIMFDFKFSDYWKFLTILIVCVLVYLLLVCIFIIFKRRILMKLKFLEIFPELILPMIGHFLFMPILLMLMTIFKCEESISEDLNDSFLDRDCSQFCYQGKHTTFVSLSSITIFLFLSISTFLRPYWEMSQSSLKINTKTSYLSIMSVFQLILILLKVNLEHYSKAASGFSICGTILVMITVVFFIKPYNYAKVTIFQVSTLAMSFWGILISTISELVSSVVELKVCLFLGFFGIFLIGLRVSSRFSSKFIEDDENSVVIFVRFQFSKRLPEMITKSKYLLKVRGDLNDNTQLQVDS